MRIIKVKNAHILGKLGEDRILAKGIWKHPRRIEMDEAFTYIEKSGKKILTLGGVDSLSGDYELEFI